MKLLYTGIFAQAAAAGNFGTYCVLEQDPRQHGRPGLWCVRGQITKASRTLSFSVSDLTPAQAIDELEKYRRLVESDLAADQDPIPF